MASLGASPYTLYTIVHSTPGGGERGSIESDTCKGTCTCEPHRSKKNEKSGVDKTLNFPGWGLISVEEKSRTESYRTSLRSSGLNFENDNFISMKTAGIVWSI